MGGPERRSLGSSHSDPPIIHHSSLIISDPPGFHARRVNGDDPDHRHPGLDRPGRTARAQTAANVAHTQALIAKLHSQLMLRYESYRTRRLPIDTTSLTVALTAYNASGGPGSPIPIQRAAAAYRLAAVRELMRMELPDRYSDLMAIPNPNVNGLPNVNNLPTSPPMVPSSFTYNAASSTWQYGPPPYIQQFIQPTATNLSYQRRCNMNAPSALFEDAECLYLIISSGLSDDAFAGEHINPGDIGDADGDGMPEFHDAWGNPIRFIRWAPAFASDLQNGNAVTNHDQFDPLKLEPAGYALYPLIYSAGPDQAADIQRAPPISAGVTFAQPSANCTFQLPFYAAPGAQQHIYDPYGTNNANFAIIGATTNDVELRGMIPGQDFDVSSADNIHNHLIGQ